MESGAGDDAVDETAPITVRYWASARAAAGVETDDAPGDRPAHPDRRRTPCGWRCTPARGCPGCSRRARSWSATSRWRRATRMPCSCGRARRWSSSRPSPAAEQPPADQGRGRCVIATSLRLSLPPLTVSLADRPDVAHVVLVVDHAGLQDRGLPGEQGMVGVHQRDHHMGAAADDGEDVLGVAGVVLLAVRRTRLRVRRS